MRAAICVKHVSSLLPPCRLSVQSKATCGAAAPVRASPYKPARQTRARCQFQSQKPTLLGPHLLVQQPRGEWSERRPRCPAPWQPRMSRQVHRLQRAATYTRGAQPRRVRPRECRAAQNVRTPRSRPTGDVQARRSSDMPRRGPPRTLARADVVQPTAAPQASAHRLRTRARHAAHHAMQPAERCESCAGHAHASRHTSSTGDSSASAGVRSAPATVASACAADCDSGDDSAPDPPATASGATRWSSPGVGWAASAAPFVDSPNTDTASTAADSTSRGAWSGVSASLMTLSAANGAPPALMSSALTIRAHTMRARARTSVSAPSDAAARSRIRGSTPSTEAPRPAAAVGDSTRTDSVSNAANAANMSAHGGFPRSSSANSPLNKPAAATADAASGPAAARRAASSQTRSRTVASAWVAKAPSPAPGANNAAKTPGVGAAAAKEDSAAAATCVLLSLSRAMSGRSSASPGVAALSSSSRPSWRAANARTPSESARVPAAAKARAEGSASAPTRVSKTRSRAPHNTRSSCDGSTAPRVRTRTRVLAEHAQRNAHTSPPRAHAARASTSAATGNSARKRVAASSLWTRQLHRKGHVRQAAHLIDAAPHSSSAATTAAAAMTAGREVRRVPALAIGRA